MKYKKTLKIILKSALRLFFLIVGVSFLTFLLMYISPLDPIQAFIQRNWGKSYSQEMQQALIAQWGLDKPFFEQYFIWLGKLLSFNLGQSMLYGRPVIKVINEGFKNSVLLLFIAWVLQGIISIKLGIIAGLKENKWQDKLISRYCLITSSIPSFWIAILLILLFAITLNWFPVSGNGPIGVPENDITFGQRLYYMILPITTLVLSGISETTLHTREKTIEFISSEPMIYAKARGIKGRTLIYKYVLKNVSLPAITLQCASLTQLFSGVVLIETAFSYKGLGSITVNAGLNGDIPLILGITVFTSIFVFLGNRLADLLYLVVDPRIKDKKEKGGKI